jgi:hypothetical protein
MLSPACGASPHVESISDVILPYSTLLQSSGQTLIPRQLGIYRQGWGQTRLLLISKMGGDGITLDAIRYRSFAGALSLREDQTRLYPPVSLSVEPTRA